MLVVLCSNDCLEVVEASMVLGRPVDLLGLGERLEEHSKICTTDPPLFHTRSNERSKIGGEQVEVSLSQPFGGEEGQEEAYS